MKEVKNELNFDEFKENLKKESPEAKAFYQSIEDYQKIINTIREERIRQNLSQRDLAKMVNIKQSQIGRIETFKICPLVTTLTKLAAALGLTIKADNETLSKAKQNNKYIVYYVNESLNGMHQFNDEKIDNKFLGNKGGTLDAKC